METFFVATFVSGLNVQGVINGQRIIVSSNHVFRRQT